MSTAITIGDVPIDGHGLGEDEVRLILERRSRAVFGRTILRETGLAVIVCLIGGERFAVPLAAVVEVLPAMTPVRVPTAPDSLAGLIVRRGLVYNLIDPSASLGVARRDSAHTLLLRGPVPRIALRVDEAIEASEVAGLASEGGGLSETRYCVDGTRVELIAPQRLVAALGHSGRVERT